MRHLSALILAGLIVASGAPALAQSDADPEDAM
jgi:hypothetical protein